MSKDEKSSIYTVYPVRPAESGQTSQLFSQEKWKGNRIVIQKENS